MPPLKDFSNDTYLKRTDKDLIREPTFGYNDGQYWSSLIKKSTYTAGLLDCSSRMTGTVLEDPQWSLERRASSGHLVWRKDTPSSKVRFRFDVEVLEFEKDPAEDIEDEFNESDGFSVSKVSSTIAICVTCMAAVAVSVFLPWYLMNS